MPGYLNPQVVRYTRVRVYRDQGSFGPVWGYGPIHAIAADGQELLLQPPHGTFRSLRDARSAVIAEASRCGIHLASRGFFAAFDILD